MDWPRLDELDDDVVTQAYEYVVQLIRERHPDADAQRGLLGSFISELHAILQGATREAIATVHNSLSATAVLANPGRARAELVDKLLANVGMSRGHVMKATGRIRVVLHRAIPVTIMRGELFKTEDDQYFLADATSSFKEPDVPIRGYNEFHLKVQGDKYSFSVPVTARDSDGPAPRRNDLIVPHVAPAGMFSAYAEDDFRGSFILQDDADVMRQLRLGMTAPGFSSRANIEALILKADPTRYRFAADIKSLKIIGADDQGGKPGLIRILLRCRDRVDVDGLLAELRNYLNDPCRACLSAKIEVEHEISS